MLIPIVFLFTISCTKDMDSSQELDFSNLKFVKYEQLLSSINLEPFKNNNQVIFKNEEGSERILYINFSDSTQKQNVNGKDIVLPKVAVNYYEPTDTKFA